MSAKRYIALYRDKHNKIWHRSIEVMSIESARNFCIRTPLEILGVPLEFICILTKQDVAELTDVMFEELRNIMLPHLKFNQPFKEYQ